MARQRRPLTTWLRTLRRKARGRGVRGLALPAAAGLVGLAGAGWLAVWIVGGAMAGGNAAALPAGDESPAPRPADSPAAAEVDPFAEAVADEDFWTTSQSRDRRWQAARMKWLADRIASFGGIESASVYVEPGRPRSLGSPARPASASVAVVFEPGRSMTPELIDAIADLVCGGVAELDRSRLRLVDNAGQSYPLAARDDRWARQRQAEIYFQSRARAALAHIPHAWVTVSARLDGPDARAASAVVSLPRSYLIALRQRQHRSDAPAPEAVQQEVRASVASALELDAEAVEARWHSDLPAPAPPAAATARPWGPIPLAAAGGAGLVGLVALGGWVRRRQRRRVAGPRRPAEAPAGEGTAEEQDIWDVLELVSAEQLLDVLEGEHPQVLAVVLSRLSPAKAAAVLGGCSEDDVAEVSARLADADACQGEALNEVAEAIEAQLGELLSRGRKQADGEHRLVSILQQAGGDTERTVLAALDRSQPQLADRLRSRLFRFDDIAWLPEWRLRGALGGAELNDVALALRTAGPEISRRVLAALPASDARQVQRRLADMPPVRLSEVENAQARLADCIARCSQAGQYEPSPQRRVLA